VPLDEIAGGPARTSLPTVCVGRVEKPPATADDPMTVVLINYSARFDYEVPASNWMPRPDRLPARGDRCTVLFDDDGDASVPVYG
jgi:hypothetical protein